MLLFSLTELLKCLIKKTIGPNVQNYSVDLECWNSTSYQAPYSTVKGAEKKSLKKKFFF